MDASQIDFYTRLAHGIAAQFGSNCETVVHDLETSDPARSIIAIENGHVTGRAVGDGPSHVVLEAIHAGRLHKLADPGLQGLWHLEVHPLQLPRRG